MSFWQDLIDWVGGYPFEVSTPEQIFDFYRSLGCNEFVFRKAVPGAAA